jgi:hypothetical protein
MRSRKALGQPVVHRSARVALRLTPAQARRCYRMLRAGGDVWAALIELNAVRFRRRGSPLLGYAELCREVAGTPVGELSVTAVRSVVKRYSDACMETARRKRRGERARYPRRRQALKPLRWYAGTFELSAGRVRLSVANGASACWLRVARPIPYPAEQVRSVTLVAEGGRLYLDVTAEVPVERHELDVNRVAGVDPGIIHPYAVAGPDEAMVISGRALRAEERLHLADTKARAARMGPKAPRRGQRGSRRWRKLRAAPEPPPPTVATGASDPHLGRQGQAGRYRRGLHRRAGDLLDLPGLPEPGVQAQGPCLYLWPLWPRRPSRCRRGHQHRRSMRRDHERACARHPPSCRGRPGAA